MLIINTKDMLNIFKSRLTALAETQGNKKEEIDVKHSIADVAAPNISAEYF